METIYDLIIVGSGPAGLSAAVYAQRAGLGTIVIEKAGMSGGQVLTTYEVDNYPGLSEINGFELGIKMREHADKLGANFIDGAVEEIIDHGDYKTIVTDQETYSTKTVIIATGATHAKLKVPGETELLGMGVSYCATCDGAFFRDKTVAVIGGGDVAVEDAIFLARTCKKVYVIHRRDELRAAKILQDKLFVLSNVEMVWDCIVINIEGTEVVEAIEITNKKTNKQESLPVQGVFVAVGIQPNTELVSSLLEVDKGGYVVAGEMGITSVPGIFVAGDARTKQLRQIVTAVADGANAITSVQNYMIEN